MKKDHKAGFVALVGRPNTGKSTLINALVGEKIAIISDKPQTTRSLIRGIISKDGYQILIVDTPGIHKPKTALGARLNELSKEAIQDVELIAMCFPADQKIGPGDQFIINQIKNSKKPLFALITKSDLVSRNELIEKLNEVSLVGEVDWSEIIPISSVSRENLETLESRIVEYLPISPVLYPSELVTDQDLEKRISELIREAALEDLTEELPHSVAVLIDEIFEADSKKGKILKIFASIYVERDSQKAILIGAQGSRLKKIGSEARKEIEKITSQKVFLDIRIKIASDWQSDAKLLSKLGFDQYN